MPFHSPAFFFLTLVAFSTYYLGGTRWQHAVLLAASLSFYYYAGLPDTLILIGSIGFNHVAAGVVARGGRQSRVALVTAVIVNVGILAFFKYRRFAVEGINYVLGTTLSLPDLVIPLGISFYIFQMIAYQVELGRGKIEREKSFLRVLLYILFFPHHQAGPIMRPADFLPQFYGRKAFRGDLVASGVAWIMWGLTKKVVADHFAAPVEKGFDAPTSLDGLFAGWYVALAYALQIYGDFSGYSDIAMGLGRLFGYELDRNFAQPYLSTNPSEFWKRWHITLSSWLRDYLYIPLGGNRRGVARTYLNLMITMVLGGLWHGASILFVLWGAIHGLLLMIHRAAPRLFAHWALGWLTTFVFTVIAWVPFRAPTWDANKYIWSLLFGLHGLGTKAAALKVVLLLFFIIGWQIGEDRLLGTGERREWVKRSWRGLPSMARGVLWGFWVLLVTLSLVDNTVYIYFRF